MLGTRRASVTVAAGRLQKAGLASYVQGQLKSEDRELLKKDRVRMLRRAATAIASLEIRIAVALRLQVEPFRFAEGGAPWTSELGGNSTKLPSLLTTL